MGYTGGTKDLPTYHSLGDHSETVEIDYDPDVISYEDLLRVFWASHNAHSRSWSRQYMSAIFYHGDEQKRLALESSDREAGRGAGKVYTEILPAATFYRAEDYHQKYSLRQRPDVVRVVSPLFKSEQDFVDSTLAARLNGYLGGAGSLAGVEEEAVRLGLTEEQSSKLLRSLR